MNPARWPWSWRITVLQNMRIQAFLTAAAVNLKRLAAALLGRLTHGMDRHT
jgi:hypothetical protein